MAAAGCNMVGLDEIGEVCVASGGRSILCSQTPREVGTEINTDAHAGTTPRCLDNLISNEVTTARKLGHTSQSKAWEIEESLAHQNPFSFIIHNLYALTSEQ
jgi:hypothetical protein